MWVIIIFVILGLSGFVLSSYSGSAAKNYVARINDTEITTNEFQRAFTNYQQRLQQQLGENYSRFFNDAMMKETVLNGMIENELLAQLTTDAGFRASGNYVYQQLEKTPAFLDENGKFSEQQYDAILQQIGYSRDRFEFEIAAEAKQKQLVDGIRNTAFSLASTINALNQLAAQQRRIDLLRIDRAKLTPEVQVSDEEIQKYYDANKSAFMTEEQVQVAYIDLDLKAISSSIQIDDSAVKDYYQSNLSRYSQAEERDASHILIKLSDAMDAQAARQKLLDIKQSLKNGKTFEDMAKEYSQDPGSAKNGGALGFVRKGLMDKPFEDALFALKVGEISEPVQSQFGLHLIKLNQIRAGKTKPLAEVKDRIRQELQLQRAESRFYNDLDTLDKLAYEHQGSLEPAAEALGISIKTSPYFSRRGGPQIWRNQKVLNAAFSDEVLKENINSDPIELAEDHVIILRLKDLKPAEQKPLEQVKAQIRSLLIQEKVANKVAELSDQVYQKLVAGTKPEDLTNIDKSLEYVQYGYIGRDQKHDSEQAKKNSLAPDIRKAVFAITKPSADKPGYHEMKTASGDGAVVILYDIREGKVDTPKAELESMQKQLANANGQMDERSVVEFMRENSDIDINKQKQDEE